MEQGDFSSNTQPVQPQYGQPVPPQYTQQMPLEIVSFVLGIVSIPMALLVNDFIGIVCGVVGLVFAIIKRNTHRATAGLICSAVGLGIGAISLLFGLLLFISIF